MNTLIATPAIELSEVTYWYRSEFLRKKVRGLMNVSLTVATGEAFGFLGPNGSGKTTTIKCLLNLIRPVSGSVKIFGIPSTDPRSRAAVGYLAEQPYFYDYLTVEETLGFYATLAGLRGIDKSSRVNGALERVGLASRRTSKVRSLSKGLTQRLALAQAIVADPKLLVLDEPFSGLDPVGRAEFREIFLDLKRKGATLLISSHILHDVELLCDRASIIVAGSLKALVNVKDLALQPSAYRIDASVDVTSISHGAKLQVLASNQQGVSMETPDRENAEKLLAAIPRDKLIRFEPIRPSLEDLFKATVKNAASGMRQS